MDGGPCEARVRFALVQGGAVVREFVSVVEADITVGELVRNACVNLGIEPDTEGGVTRNVALFRGDGEGGAAPWAYDPYSTLRDAGIAGDSRILVRERAGAGADAPRRGPPSGAVRA